MDDYLAYLADVNKQFEKANPGKQMLRSVKTAPDLVYL